MRGAKSIVHEDVAQGGHLAGEVFVVLLLAFVDAAVFQQHHLAWLDLDAIDPVADQRHVAAQELAQALGHRGQRVFGLELALGRAAQVGRDHDGGTGIQRHANSGHAGTHAGVFGDVAGVVLRDIQIGADEHTLASGLALGAEVGKTDDFHVEEGFEVQKSTRILEAWTDVA